ncbi:MAG: peptidase, partial [Rhodobacter sp.]|nr:peptidase [Rhodobacter sp.]
MKRLILATGIVVLGAETAAIADEGVSDAAVLDTYADIAEAAYSDSLLAAQRLNEAVSALISSPSAEALVAAKMAWLAARVPYQQTEVYRFGN